MKTEYIKPNIFTLSFEGTVIAATSDGVMPSDGSQTGSTTVGGDGTGTVTEPSGDAGGDFGAKKHSGVSWTLDD